MLRQTDLSRQVVQAMIPNHVPVWLLQGVKHLQKCVQGCFRLCFGVVAVQNIPCHSKLFILPCHPCSISKHAPDKTI